MAQNMNSCFTVFHLVSIHIPHADKMINSYRFYHYHEEYDSKYAEDDWYYAKTQNSSFAYCITHITSTYTCPNIPIYVQANKLWSKSESNLLPLTSDTLP